VRGGYEKTAFNLQDENKSPRKLDLVIKVLEEVHAVIVEQRGRRGKDSRKRTRALFSGKEVQDRKTLNSDFFSSKKIKLHREGEKNRDRNGLIPKQGGEKLVKSEH